MMTFTGKLEPNIVKEDIARTQEQKLSRSNGEDLNLCSALAYSNFNIARIVFVIYASFESAHAY